jgi:hypothetical protein
MAMARHRFTWRRQGLGNRQSHPFGGLVAAAILAVAACGGGTATPAPTAAPTAAPQVSVPPVATAPGGGGGGGAPAAAADASAILTADMAASIIGGSPTKAMVATPGTGVSLVSYTNSNGDDVTVLVEAVPAGFAGTMLQAAIAGAGAQGQLQPLSGIGDAAGKVIDDHDATVAFAKGSTLVVIHASADGVAGSDLESKCEALARQIAGRL